MLSKLWRWLFCPGECNWDEILHSDILSYDGKRKYGDRYVSRCKTCGHIKTVKSWN